MPAPAETPRLDQLQTGLAAGDLDTVRGILLDLDGEEQRLLEQEMGKEAFDRARRSAGRGRRRGKLGKVLVLPGIMGSELDSVDSSGDADRIWINFVNLILGRISDFELTPEGEPAKAGVHIRTAGVHRKTYVPILMELDSRWHVRPFAFDWREDIDRSAARLEGEIKAFGEGGPVHLIGHSMGGLVARRFVHRFPDTWAAMDDPKGHARGGRLVMMGTPNRGSFAIPLVFTGGEKLIRGLATGDVHHSLAEILAIIATFPGMYQMLPSPTADLDGDDHGRLYDHATWGSVPVPQPLLERARAFFADLEEVHDPDRLVYVAGYDRHTPFRVKVEAPGKFSFGDTRDGDGRVPHVLGLLQGVKTYWVAEDHGALPKNTKVLDAVSDLLQRGETSVLPAQKPATRSATRAPRPGRRDVEPVPPEAEAILVKAQATRGPDGEPDLTPEEQVRLENLLTEPYLGSGDEAEDAAGAVTEDGAAVAASARRAKPIEVEVVWGDVTKIDADVYSVGHYEGVLPQNAELALDCAVSGISMGDEAARSRLVITRHTRRGMLRAALGDVTFFPWADPRHRGRQVAVAGMGRPGTFDSRALVRLVRELMLSLAVLPHVKTVCTVLIGSGAGTLSVREAVRGLVRGISDAASEIAADPAFADSTSLNRLLVAERERSRAFEVLNALESEIAQSTDAPIKLRRKLRTGPGGGVSVEEGLALVVESAVAAASSPARSRAGRALATLVDDISAPEAVRTLALEGVKGFQPDGSGGPSFDLPRFRVERRVAPPASAEVPSRISFWDDGRAIRVAAIHQAATVPERLVRVDPKLVGELVERTTDPPPEEVNDLSDLVLQLLVPSDFWDVLRSGPLVFEVDRSTAQVHWEFLSAVDDDGDADGPLAVRLPMARQLRTLYSPPPLPRPRSRSVIRALVIGDPGDPANGDSLDGARNEALKVVELLSARADVEVDARIGAPTVPREGPLAGIKPANRLDILALLLQGDFDLVHYAGHGDFDPAEPDRVGWVFAGGLLTPRELERLERVPSIVVANACLTARTSQAIAEAKQGDGDDPRSEAGLLPSLADEFFRLGVRNYIGAAWEVNDLGATMFAETFYRSILPADGTGGGSCFGEAMLAARLALWQQRDLYGPLWAAYQHYGDPSTDTGLTTDASAGA